MELQPYQQRVVDEKTELDSKLLALSKFIDGSPIFSELPVDEKDRLICQAHYMQKYSDILGERITAFGGKIIQPTLGKPPTQDVLPNTSFGDALVALEQGKRLARAGWNGKGMFVYMVPANSYPAQTGAAKAHFGENALVPYAAYLALKGVNDVVSTWVPSINDCLAKDWSILD